MLALPFEVKLRLTYIKWLDRVGGNALLAQPAEMRNRPLRGGTLPGQNAQLCQKSDIMPYIS
jgi:hypothetical protein